MFLQRVIDRDTETISACGDEPSNANVNTSYYNHIKASATDSKFIPNTTTQ